MTSLFRLRESHDSVHGSSGFRLQRANIFVSIITMSLDLKKYGMREKSENRNGTPIRKGGGE